MRAASPPRHAPCQPSRLPCKVMVQVMESCLPSGVSAVRMDGAGGPVHSAGFLEGRLGQAPLGPWPGSVLGVCVKPLKMGIVRHLCGVNLSCGSQRLDGWSGRPGGRGKASAACRVAALCG
ncbi:hypothetical protein E2C01_032357 [Portunus trituberculatus]|uniref:Uncharacterized protein n=1 Tax=Portunus trituberculatus TaxID=210409 RepID=A0A5B7EVT3_PORTR|nr:hypothetical protein [Portunus trituberculatus]